MNTNRGAAVYRFYAGDGELLYIGCSLRPLHRMAEHISNRRRDTQITDIKMQWYPTLVEARNAETEAIRLERPKWNVHHNREAV